MTHKETYNSWRAMKARCNNPNNNRYRYYGGKGITVCERWDKYKNFLEDMGERPTSLTLDRVDNEGHYEPSNCRWSNIRTQCENRTNNASFIGVSWSKLYSKWKAYASYDRSEGKYKHIGVYNTHLAACYARWAFDMEAV